MGKGETSEREVEAVEWGIQSLLSNSAGTNQAALLSFFMYLLSIYTRFSIPLPWLDQAG
jgi:hypothetical protein